MNVIYNYAAAPEFAADLAALGARGIAVSVCPESDNERLFELLGTADVLWHVLRPVDREVIGRAPRLKLVQKIGVGVNTIDLEYARSKGIAVCNMPGTNSAAVAEHTIALILAVLRRLGSFDSELRSGHGWAWPPERQDRLGEIGGRTVGLVGFGAVPQKLAPVLTAMGAEVIYTARSRHADVDYEFLSLEALLSRAEIVSLHVPLTAETTSLLDASRFGVMRRGSVLVNTARGGLVDESAFLAALDSGRLMGAGLDVFAEEPLPPGHALFGRDDVVLTPHVAWLTRETLARSMAVAVDNCRRLANAKPLQYRVM